ncbi:MAG: ABC transporter permease subunit [Candidatus Sericytochromatia bacterium]|nr:ABC transporter permease subunit [Candidatus Sericytochromatia bacterium]
MNVPVLPSLRRVLAIASCDWRCFHRQGTWLGGVTMAAVVGVLAAAAVRADPLAGVVLLELVVGALSLVGAAIALMLGSQVVAREVRDGTWMVVLARPVSRAEFLAGKFLGVAAVLGELGLFGGALLGAMMTVGAPWEPLLAVLCLALWVKWCLVAALAILFATLTSGTLALLYASALFVLGHAGGLVRTFAESEQLLNRANHWGGLLFYYLVPHFELFELRVAGLAGPGWNWSGPLAALAYGASLCVALLGLARLAWEAREL